MSIVQIEAQVSTDRLMKGVSQLPQPELEEFVHQVIVLQAQRKAPSLPKAETDLLLRINQGLPLETQTQYDELVAKRRAETLTPDEHDRLLRLSCQVEDLQAHRLEHLAQLAVLRKTSLTALIASLGIRTPTYV